MNLETVMDKLDRIEGLILCQLDKPLNFGEACTYLSLSASALYKKCCHSEIKHYKSGKRLFFLRDDLNAYLLRRPVRDAQEIEAETIRRVTAGGGNGR